MILDQTNVQSLSTEELQEIVWEMHKQIHGVRPRWMSTREDYLQFLNYELTPEMLEQRKAEYEAEEAYYKEQEDLIFGQHAIQEEMWDYPGARFEHLEVF